MKSMIKDLTIQDFLAFIVSVGVFGLILCKYTVPDQIWSGWMVIITFFFNQPQKAGVITTSAPKDSTVTQTTVTEIPKGV